MDAPERRFDLEMGELPGQRISSHISCGNCTGDCQNCNRGDVCLEAVYILVEHLGELFDEALLVHGRIEEFYRVGDVLH